MGFLGGWERWDDSNRGVRKVALQIRQWQFPGVHVETFGNHQRSVALDLIRRVLDCNGNGVVDPVERSCVRIILYGQSFGGACVINTARDLEKMGVPVALT